MNIVLHDLKADEFYLASLKKSGDQFWAFGRKVDKNGKLKTTGQIFKFSDRRDAENKVRDLVKIKIKMRHWKHIPLDTLPKKVVDLLEVPPEMHVSAEEMVIILRNAKMERYFVLSDVLGLEEYFDAGVEYVGYKTEDEETVKVFDRYGTMRECFVSRIRAMKMTEQALEACEVKKREGTPAMKPAFVSSKTFENEKQQFAKAIS